jgi:hypothetical protein
MAVSRKLVQQEFLQLFVKKDPTMNGEMLQGVTHCWSCWKLCPLCLMKTRLDIVFTFKGPLELNVKYCISNAIMHIATYKEIIF